MSKSKKNVPGVLSERPISFYPSLGRMLNNANHAIMFQQLHFLLYITEEADNTHNFVNDRWWVYNSYEQWKKSYFPWLSVPTIQRCFARLELLGIVDSMQSVKHKSDRRKWYSINYKLYTDLYERWDNTEVSYQNDMMVDYIKLMSSKVSKRHDGYSETTTETTQRKDISIASAKAAGGAATCKCGNSYSVDYVYGAGHDGGYCQTCIDIAIGTTTSTCTVCKEDKLVSKHYPSLNDNSKFVYTCEDCTMWIYDGMDGYPPIQHINVDWNTSVHVNTLADYIEGESKMEYGNISSKVKVPNSITLDGETYLAVRTAYDDIQQLIGGCECLDDYVIHTLYAVDGKPSENIAVCLDCGNMEYGREHSKFWRNTDHTCDDGCVNCKCGKDEITCIYCQTTLNLEVESYHPSICDKCYPIHAPTEEFRTKMCWHNSPNKCGFRIERRTCVNCELFVYDDKYGLLHNKQQPNSIAQYHKSNDKFDKLMAFDVKTAYHQPCWRDNNIDCDNSMACTTCEYLDEEIQHAAELAKNELLHNKQQLHKSNDKFDKLMESDVESAYHQPCWSDDSVDCDDSMTCATCEHMDNAVQNKDSLIALEAYRESELFDSKQQLDAPPPVKKKATPHKDMVAAIVAAMGYTDDDITSWGEYNTASKKLRKANITPDEVPALYTFCSQLATRGNYKFKSPVQLTRDLPEYRKQQRQQKQVQTQVNTDEPQPLDASDVVTYEDVDNG